MTNIELQYFYGGPLHNLVITASELLHTPRADISDYKWTPKTITGSESGREARVWAYKDSIAQ